MRKTRNLLGVGTNSGGEFRTKTKAFYVWENMLRRCYGTIEPAYVGCTVDKRWLDYQDFARWYTENAIEGWHLDKDILIQGNKIYSPETCCFVPQDINKNFMRYRGGIYPQGVEKAKNKYSARISKYNKTEYLGNYDTIELASQAFREAREAHIKELAELYKPQLKPATYEALIKYRLPALQK